MIPKQVFTGFPEAPSCRVKVKKKNNLKINSLSMDFESEWCTQT